MVEAHVRLLGGGGAGFALRQTATRTSALYTICVVPGDFVWFLVRVDMTVERMTNGARTRSFSGWKRA